MGVYRCLTREKHARAYIDIEWIFSEEAWLARIIGGVSARISCCLYYIRSNKFIFLINMAILDEFSCIVIVSKSIQIIAELIK